jgi:outer membrane biosynthesis protein TonB
MNSTESITTRYTQGRRVRLITAAAGMVLAAMLALAPAASAAPLEVCPLEQGPDGPQCQKPVEKPQFELCDLEQGPNGLQCKKPGFEKPDFPICDLEQGPDGPQCVDDDPDPEDPGPDVEPEPEEPPVDPQPDPKPEPNGDSNPKPQPQPEQPAAGDDQPTADAVQIASEDAGIPVTQVEAGPAVEQPDRKSYAGWVVLGLVALGGIFAFLRRRRSEDDAADAIDRM